MDKIIGIMKVKDEEDILPVMLEQSKWLDGLVVLDNGSIDNTNKILQECPLVLDCIYDDSLFNEVVMSKKLLEIASKYNSEWYAEVDADEIFDKEIYEVKNINLSEYNTIAYNIHYMVDGMCYKMYKNWMRIYRNLGSELIDNLDKVHSLHWGKNPIPKENRKIYYSNIPVYHYQIRSYEQGMRKYKRYIEELDPELKYQPNGYEHLKIVAECIKERNYIKLGIL
jgi:hypothetical protein